MNCWIETDSKRQRVRQCSVDGKYIQMGSNVSKLHKDRMHSVGWVIGKSTHLFCE